MSSEFNRRVLIALVGATGAMSLAPVSARAWTPIVSSDVFSSPPINFNNLPRGPITNPNVLLTDGIRFVLNGGARVLFDISTGSGRNLIDIIGSGAGETGEFVIDFVTPAGVPVTVDAAGVNYWTDSRLTFTAYEADLVTVIGRAYSPIGADAGFFGVDGQGEGIARIVVNDHEWGFQIDNLTFGSTIAAVPAPGAAALAGLGLLLVGLGRRRLT